MNLTETPEVVQWPRTHYVFVEKIGPFQETAMAAWQEFHRLKPDLQAKNHIRPEHFSLYKMGPPNVYRAGVAIEGPPIDLPAGLQYEEFEGGKYSCLTYTGPYSALGQVSGKAWEIAHEKVAMRPGFAIENYVNDPKSTPEEELITEILIPTA
jgi:DNA gyrase inhibitor GyrI